MRRPTSDRKHNFIEECINCAIHQCVVEELAQPFEKQEIEAGVRDAGVARVRAQLGAQRAGQPVGGIHKSDTLTCETVATRRPICRGRIVADDIVAGPMVHNERPGRARRHSKSSTQKVLHLKMFAAIGRIFATRREVR